MILYVIFFILLVPFAFTPTFVFIFNAFFIIRIRNISIKRPSNFELLYLIYLAYTILSIPFSNDIGRSLKLIIFNLLFIVSYVTIIDYIKKISIERFYYYLHRSLKYYVYISIGYFLLGVISYYLLDGTLNESNNIFGLHVDDFRPRFNGLGTSPSSYGLIASLFLLICIQRKDKWNILLVSASIILTISWTVFLSVFIGLFIYQNSKNIKASFKYVLLMLGMLIILYFIIQSNEFLLQILEYRLRNLSSGTHRFEIWDSTINEIKHNPFFGSGYNFAPIYLKGLMGEDSLSSLHNVFIQVLFEQGIIGIALFIAFFGSFMRQSYIQSRKGITFDFVFPWAIVFFIQMNAAVLIFSPNFLFLLIIVKKLILDNHKKCYNLEKIKYNILDYSSIKT